MHIFVGADVKLIAQATKAGGDGFADLGFLRGVTTNAQGRSGLGNVWIDGDLGKFVSSPRTFDPLYPIQYESSLNVAKSFHVHSLGAFGTATGAPDLFSLFDGKVDTFRVDTDVREASARFAGDVRVLWVGGDVVGGAEIGSGAIFVTGDLSRGYIGGDVIGGSGQDSGRVGNEVGTAKQLTVAGDLIGGTGRWSGMIGPHQLLQVGAPVGGVIRNLKIGHDIVGGSGELAGGVYPFFDIDSTIIGGSVRDGGYFTPPGGKRLEIKGDVAGGRVVVEHLDQLWIRGSITGGDLDDSGVVRILDVGQRNHTKSFKVGGDILGGDGARSGQLVIRGAVQGGSIGGDVRGGDGAESGWLRVSVVHSYTVGGDVIGGGGIESGTLRRGDGGGQFSKVIIKGDVRTGSAPGSGVLASVGAASLTILGGLYGNAAVTAVVQGQLTVLGNVEDAILGFGFDNLGDVTWAGGIFSKLDIRGDFIRSSIIDGVVAGPDGFYGTDDDKLHAVTGSGASRYSIENVVIRGRVLGDTGGHHGIVAPEITNLTISGHKVKLTPGGDNDVIEWGAGGNFTIREIPGP